MRAGIFFKPSAEREFRRLPRDIKLRFAKVFELLAEEPIRRRPGLDIKPLRGVRGSWRLRVGDYRGIYDFEPGMVRFTRFGHRSDVYEV